ncbi:MAG: ABC transporter ATP-binding protein [Candidatus Dormiibacterota bacterium]
MNVAIEATCVSKRYRSAWALRDCSLKIPAGRVVALVGPNGAGKTTLLHLAMGLLPPTSGSISVFGWSPQHQPMLLLPRVGFIAQERPLYRRLRARELLEFGRRLNPRWDGARAQSRIARFDVDPNQRIGKLSGGQQAEVALALTLAKRPDLLLLDEPLSSLDPLARREFLQVLMEAVTEEGTSVVLSSHILGELERTCDYLVILCQGRVQVAGDIDSLLAGHRILVGPRASADDVARDPTVVQASHAPQQTTLLVRTNGSSPDPQWEQHEVSLEELALAYLGRPSVGMIADPLGSARTHH